MLLDTTLREGEQTKGVSFSVEEKKEIASMVDVLGIEMIEAGHPSVSPNVAKAVKEISEMGLNADILAHARAVEGDIQVAADCGVDMVAIFLATSDIHLRNRLKSTKEETLEKIRKALTYAKDLGVRTRFTAEDSLRTDIDFLIDVVKVIEECGAERISLTDTIGKALPYRFYRIVKNVREETKIGIDVHCHNDFGLAIANSLEGLRAGADCVHVTVNGLGERAGITSLSEMVMILHVLNHEANYEIGLLPLLSEYVAKASGIPNSPLTPITGANVFTHKSGLHGDGVLKDPKTFEAFPPEILNREREIIVGEYSGRSVLENKLLQLGIELSDSEFEDVVSKVKSGELSEDDLWRLK